MNANNLVHICGGGDFQVEMIEALGDPYRIRNRGDKDEGRWNYQFYYFYDQFEI